VKTVLSAFRAEPTVLISAAVNTASTNPTLPTGNKVVNSYNIYKVINESDSPNMLLSRLSEITHPLSDDKVKAKKDKWDEKIDEVAQNYLYYFNIKVISGRKIMAANLMNVFKNTDLKNVGKSMSDVVSLAFKPNKKTGAKIARAVLSDGTTLIKSVTASGVVSETIHKLPEIASVAQRNEVIRDLAKHPIQSTICESIRRNAVERLQVTERHGNYNEKEPFKVIYGRR